MPSGSGIKGSIAKLSGKDYDEGAVLTLTDMPTVTPSDVCVIVGAKEGSSATNDNGLALGQFKYEAQATGTQGSHNFVFLLFDHIYSALRFSLKVDDEYDKLRTIVLKKMVLRVSEGAGTVTTRADITIKLSKKTDGTSPIEDITYTYRDTNEESEPLFKSNTGLKLTTTATDFRGSFVPKDINAFTLESTYDVYDKKDNAIRTNCTAANKISIADLFYPSESLKRGKIFTVNLTIEPTYLYVLADPDLDNPTVTLNIDN
jgi:hypothetical protein